jgi:hypothetical protein
MRACAYRFRLREDDAVRLWPAVESEDFGPVPLPDRVLRNISVPDFVVPLYQYDLLWQRQLLRALRVSSPTARLRSTRPSAASTTSAPGLDHCRRRIQLRQDSLHGRPHRPIGDGTSRCHIRTGTGLTPAHICSLAHPSWCSAHSGRVAQRRARSHASGRQDSACEARGSAADRSVRRNAMRCDAMRPRCCVPSADHIATARAAQHVAGWGPQYLVGPRDVHRDVPGTGHICTGTGLTRLHALSSTSTDPLGRRACI